MLYDENAIRFYGENPVAFVEDVVGTSLDPWQCDVLNALRDKHFVTIRSGSGVGKTALMSLASMWFLATHPNAKVPTTAPSQHQLYDILWSEHAKWINKSEILKQILVWTQTKVSLKGYESTWFAVARTSRVSPGGVVAEGLQGFHSSENLLFLVDEASGVADQVFPAIEGALTGKNAYAILAGNPTRRNGYFFDSFNSLKMRGMYVPFHVSCYDSSRVSSRYISMMEARYGKNHPVFMIKVLGEFSEMDDDMLVPLDFIEKMQNNAKDTSFDSFPIELGIDVGRTHASSVCFVRQGNNILEWQEYHKKGQVTDTEMVCRWASEIINTYDPSVVRIDSIGIGAGVYDGLKGLYGKMIVPFIGGARAYHSDQFVNLRAESYWKLRDLVPNLYAKQWPDRLILELSDMRYSRRTGKIQVESKDAMLTRALQSPDFADALSYAMYDEEIAERSNVVPFHSLFQDINQGFAAQHASIWSNYESRPQHDRWKELRH